MYIFRSAGNQLGLPAGADGFRFGADFSRSALDDSVDEAYKAVEKPGLDTGYGVGADQGRRLAKIHFGKFGGAREHAGDGHVDAGADHATQVFAFGGNDVEVDGGSEIDHDRRAAVK